MDEKTNWNKSKYYYDSISLFIAIIMFIGFLLSPLFVSDLKQDIQNALWYEWIIIVVLYCLFLFGIIAALRSIRDFQYKFYFCEQYFVIKRLLITQKVYYSDVEKMIIVRTNSWQGSLKRRLKAHRIKIYGKSNTVFLLHTKGKEMEFFRVLNKMISKDKRSKRGKYRDTKILRTSK